MIYSEIRMIVYEFHCREEMSTLLLELCSLD